MQRHGRPVDGCAGEEQEDKGVVWSVVEAVTQLMVLYADDADLIDRDACSAERRVDVLADGSERDADMVVSIKKTEVMHVRRQDRVSASTLEDYAQLDLAHKCVCGYSFDTYHQLAIHAARWCEKAKFERETCNEEHVPERVLNAIGPLQHRWYVVQWEGYESVFWDDFSEATVEPAEHMEHHQEVIDEYFSSVPADVEGDLDHPVCVRSVETGEECDKCLCVYCGKLYASRSTRQAHLTTGCKERPRSRKGTKADRKVQQLKRVRQQAERQHVSMQGKALTNVYTFKYLGFSLQADGDRRQAMQIRMAIAGVRFSDCNKIWRSDRVNLRDKIRLFNSGVVSVLVYGCEAWVLDESCQASLRGWCARYMSKLTGRSIREECVDPTFKLVGKIRVRRLRWLGHVLRSSERSFMRKLVVAQSEEVLRSGGKYPEGSIMMDAPAHSSVEELIMMAEDRDDWRIIVYSIM